MYILKVMMLNNMIIKKEDIKLVKEIIKKSKLFWGTSYTSDEEINLRCDSLRDTSDKLNDKYESIGSLISTICKYYIYRTNSNYGITLKLVEETLKAFDVYFEE